MQPCIVTAECAAFRWFYLFASKMAGIAAEHAGIFAVPAGVAALRQHLESVNPDNTEESVV